MIDMVLLVVIGLSALLGLMRGFVGIVIGLLSWLLACWAAWLFGDQAGHWLAGAAEPTLTQLLGGYVLVIVLVMVAMSLLGSLLRAALAVTRLTLFDRLAGFGLGAVRGALFCCLLLVAASFSPLDMSAPVWRESRVMPMLAPGADWMRAQLPSPRLPELNVDRFSLPGLGNTAATGDNGGLSEQIVGQGLQQVATRVMQAEQAARAARAPAQPLPANIDPAQVSADHADPARVEPSGQARPPSR